MIETQTTKTKPNIFITMIITIIVLFFLFFILIVGGLIFIGATHSDYSSQDTTRDDIPPIQGKFIQASEYYGNYLKENPNKAVKMYTVDNGDSVTFVTEIIDK